MSTSNHWYDEDIAGTFVDIARRGHEEGSPEARRRLVFNRGVMETLRTRIHHESRRSADIRLSVRDYCESIGADVCHETRRGDGAVLDDAVVNDFLAGFGLWLISDDGAFRALYRTAVDIPDFVQYRKVLTSGATVRNLLRSFFREYLDGERRRRDIDVYDGVVTADGGGESAARQREDTDLSRALDYEAALRPGGQAISERFDRLRELVVERVRDDDDRQRALGLMLLTMPILDTWELSEADALRRLFPERGERLVDGCNELIREYGDRIGEHARILAGHEGKAASSRAKLVELERQRQRNPSGDVQRQVAERMRLLAEHVRALRAQEQSIMKQELELVSESSLAALLGVDATRGRNALKRAKRLFKQLFERVYGRAGAH